MTGGKPFQSKLNPHFELIRELRAKRTPYPEIARILREEHGLSVGPTTIFDFVKVRSRKRDVYAISEDQTVPTTAVPSPPQPANAPRAKTSRPKSSVPAITRADQTRRPRATNQRNSHAR